jgi:integrase
MATYRTRDGRTQARIVGPDGKQIAKSFRTKTLAKLWATEAEADVARRVFIDPRSGETTFDTYAAGWLDERKRRLAPGTWKRDESYLRSLILPHLGSYPVGAIRTSDISGWISELDAKDSTKATAFQITRSVLERARRDKAIASNPADDVQSRPSPKRTARPGRALSDGELARVVQAAYDTNAATAFIVVALARLGLRIGEALGLRRDDFDLKAGTVAIQRSRDRDGTARPLKAHDEGDERVIPLPQDVANAYRSHINGQTATPISGELFVTERGTLMTYSNWRRRHWVPTIALADVGHLVPHDLRHSCVTRLFVVDRWTPAEVQAFVGHSDARITLEIYSHVNPSELPIPSPISFEIGQE